MLTRHRRLQSVAAAVAAACVSGCAGQKPLGTATGAIPVLPPTRVADAVSAGALKEKHKGVAIMKIDAVSHDCLSASVTLGRRDGDAFAPAETLRVAGPRVPNRSNVAEAELAAGEYHVVAYTCQLGARFYSMMRMEGGKYRSSYASFSVAAGEVVNVGHLKIIPLAVSQQVQNVRVTNNVMHVTVTDWSMTDLEGFKKERPALYGQMQTRLAAVTKAGPMTEAQRQELCQKAKQLKADGKVQNLPPLCLPGAQLPGTAPKPIKPEVKA